MNFKKFFLFLSFLVLVSASSLAFAINEQEKTEDLNTLITNFFKAIDGELTTQVARLEKFKNEKDLECFIGYVQLNRHFCNVWLSKLHNIMHKELIVQIQQLKQKLISLEDAIKKFCSKELSGHGEYWNEYLLLLRLDTICPLNN